MKTKTEEIFYSFMESEWKREQKKKENREALGEDLKKNIGQVLKDLANPLSSLSLYISSVHTYNTIENKVNLGIKKEVILEINQFARLQFDFSLFKIDSDITEGYEGIRDYLYITVRKINPDDGMIIFSKSYPWNDPDFLEYAEYVSKIQKVMKFTKRDNGDIKEKPKPVYSDGSNLNDYPPLRG